MGVPTAGFGLLFDVVDRVKTFVDVFFLVYLLLVFAYVLTSWIRLPYSLNKVQRFLHDVVDPYLRLFRRVLPPLGPMDFSPVVGIFVLYGIRYGIDKILDLLH
jgi:YggT family protein